MSDLYDSLEDGEGEETSDEDDRPLSIPESLRTGRMESADEAHSPSRGSDAWRDVEETLSDGNNAPEKGTCFRGNDEEPIRKNIVVDEATLNKTGLQMNEDGSFSRSPRLDVEELPFVTREYQNLLFQKRQTYQLNKPGSRKGKRGKEKIAGKEKGGQVRGRSLSLNRGRNKELFLHNLTDAMKQKLLEKHMENSPGNRLDDRLRKVKPIVNFLECSGRLISGGDDVSATRRSLLSSESFTKLPVVSPPLKPSNNCLTRRPPSGRKSGNSRVLKNKSDASIHPIKPQLSYLERHQRENGFNPLCLRYNYAKCVSDTNRSNFGDSIAGELSVSSRALSTGKIQKDDQEESFYRELMERDKKEQLIQRSSRSEAQLETKKLIELVMSNSCKDQNELKGLRKTIPGSKQKKKFTAIDFVSPSRQVHPPPCPLKKNCHYCAQNPASTMTKAELALKARAYGFMVNARNVFKLRNQSITLKNKLEKPKENLVEPSDTIKDRLTDSARKKSENFIPALTKKSFPEVTKSSGAMTTPVKRKSNVQLPRFDSPARDADFAAEILQQIRLCLDKDVSYPSRNLSSRPPRKFISRSEQMFQRIAASEN